MSGGSPATLDPWARACKFLINKSIKIISIICEVQPEKGGTREESSFTSLEKKSEDNDLIVTKGDKGESTSQT